MRHLRIALALASLPLAASGCFEDVLTLQPLHTERTVVDEPQLVGTWKFLVPGGLDCDLTCQVSATADHGYRIVVDANGRKQTYIGYVVQLGKMRIIDLSTESTGKQASATASPPGHWFARIECEQDRLTIYQASSQAFRRQVQTHPLASHTKDEKLIVTASTAELQRFFLETSAAAFPKDEKVVLHKCAPGEVLKPAFIGLDPFGTPWTLFSSATHLSPTGRLKMPPLTGAPFARLNQVAKAFVRAGHEVRFTRGSRAPSADKVHAIEAQDPLPGKLLRPESVVILTLYTNDTSDPLPPVPNPFTNPDR